MFVDVSETTFELCPAGTFVGVCTRIIDLGTRATKFGDKREVRVQFEIPSQVSADGKPLAVHERYTLSGHPKSNFRKMLEMWRGKPFTDEEMKAFDLKNLLGVHGYITVSHRENGDATYADILSVSPVPDRIERPLPSETPFAVSLNVDEFDPECFDRLGKHLQEQIKKTVEYQRLNAGMVVKSDAVAF